MSAKLAIACLALLLGSCSELGTDPNGPNKAFLVLKSDSGTIREFYLGGYNSVDACVSQLKYETDSASDRGDFFWTNADFSYGGVAEKGWNRNLIVGAKCTT